jgi:hypothetical protein
MPKPHPTRTFIRLVRLQNTAWKHGHKRWAKALGERLRDLRADFPDLAAYA